MGTTKFNRRWGYSAMDQHTTAMFLVTSPVVLIVPTRGLLAVETMHAIVQWLVNLNIKEIRRQCL